MVATKEQSAVDAIFEILEEIKLIRQEQTVIDNNIKLLNNRLNKLTMPVAVAPNTTTVQNVNQAIQKPQQESHKVKVFGRIKNQHQKPMKDVYIKIYDARGTILMSRTTNEDGYWEARVVAGEYVVELDARHIFKKFTIQNINIKVDETMNEFEVKKAG